MTNVNMTDVNRFLFGAARFRCYFSYLAPYLAPSLDHAPLTLLSRLGRFLFFLVAAGFLSAVLTACAGGSSSSIGLIGNGSMTDGSGDSGPGDNGSGDNGSGSDASSDDDNDGMENAMDNCPLVANPDQTNTDKDGEGDVCDEDDDNDGLDDVDERERQTNSDEVRCSLLVDCDGDSVMDIDEVAAACVIKADCDDDHVRDGDEVAAACVIKADCDDDHVRDGDEVAAACVMKADCDDDHVRDGDEAAAECVQDNDCDNDNSMDGTDIDDDGDGLIEIATAAQLDAVRYALNGVGRKLTASEALDSTGCGNGTTASCSGYELVANISLATYMSADGGKGWQPLGHDTASGTIGCQGDAFDGIFEGNGWTISDLNISRSDEDCVGLFGHITASSEIRNLTLSAEAVTARNRVGTLVGDGSGSRIVSSSVMVGEVKGDNAVGGLVGLGSSARIASSSVVAAGVVSEIDNFKLSIGGLVGSGTSVWIASSSVVLGSLRGGQSIGGLVGDGTSARIASSSVVAGEVRGTGQLGGLIGSGSGTQIVSSSVVVGELEGSIDLGGLVGALTFSQVAYSYVVSGSMTSMLVGRGSGTGVASYWDSETSGVTNGNYGEAKTSNDLREPTDYTGIYEEWDDDINIFNDGMSDEPLAVWCDKDNSGSIESDERTNDNLIWDFGESDEYPAIRCTPLDPEDWRDWWSLEGTPAKPRLNWDRLDNLLP